MMILLVTFFFVKFPLSFAGRRPCMAVGAPCGAGGLPSSAGIVELSSARARFFGERRLGAP